MRFFFIILFLIAVAFGIVAFQNNVEISVKFIKWDFTGHIAIVLGVPFLIGLVGGISLLLPSLWKKASQARHARKRIQELEEEMSKPDETEEGEAEDETGSEMTLHESGDRVH